MSDEPRDRKVEVKVSDKRGSSGGGAAGAPSAPLTHPVSKGSLREGASSPESDAPSDQVPLEDYLRLKAEFDNYRKRMMKDQTAMAERATIGLVEKLLPVLDSFDYAASHSEDAAGIAMLGKQLKDVLASEGLEEIPALGERFDPTVHEAVDTIEDPDVDEPVVRQVFRAGYRLKGRVIRPAMVVVARPEESGKPDEQDVAEG
jgi:molecular chaperone GrpE (heat shock protein)